MMTRTPPRPDSGPRKAAQKLHATRERTKSTRTGAIVWRTVVTAIGAAIVVVGVFLLPLPGPGWLIIFAGLAVLATEYVWASRLLQRARRMVGTWTDWVQARSRPVQALIGLGFMIFAAGVAYASWYVYLR